MKAKMALALKAKLMLWHAMCHPFAHPSVDLTVKQQVRCEIAAHEFLEASRRFHQIYGKQADDDSN